MESLKDNHIRLRALEPEDLHLLQRWENNETWWEHGNIHRPFSRYILSEYLQQAHQDIFQAGQMRLVIQLLDGPAIGLIDFFDFDAFHQRTGIGILIGDDRHRGKGLAHKALGLACDYGFQHLGLRQIHCTIASDNQASKKLFVKSGFKYCGTRKDWIRRGDDFIDEELYQLMKDKK
jgi:diamine N-acetyltransferase